MNGAEFRTLRDSLGLTGQLVGDEAGTSRRTVNNWETEVFKIPESAVNAITALAETLEKEVKRYVKPALRVNKKNDTVVIPRYKTEEDFWTFHPEFEGYPLAFHSQIISNAMREIKAHGVKVRVTYMRPELYKKWLDGREDTHRMRAQWAARDLAILEM